MDRFEPREAELRLMSFLNWMNMNEYGILGTSDGGIEIFDSKAREPLCIIRHDGKRWRAMERRVDCKCCSPYYAEKHQLQTQNIGFGPELPKFRELFAGLDSENPETD